MNTGFKPLEIGPDGWAQGVCCGEFAIGRPDSVLDPEAPEGRQTAITEIVTPEDCDAMIADWQASGKPLLLVDADHSADLGTSTAAYFWVADMRRCPDGVEVLLQPTSRGKKEVVDGRVWRYLSPVFPWDAYEYDDPAKLRGHPRRVTNFGLTNFPRMRGNRPVVHAAGSAAPRQPQQEKGAGMDYKTMLLALLKLDPESGDEQIQAAYDAAQEAEADAAATEAMNAAKIPDDEDTRAALNSIFRKDREAGLNAIAAAAKAMHAARPAASKPEKTQRALHTEATKRPAAAAGKGSGFAAKAAALNSVMQANPGISCSQALDIARKQDPDAFA